MFSHARRELRDRGQGVVVFSCCLFLGVFAMSLIGTFSAAIDAGVRKDARALLGGDLELTQAQFPLAAEDEAFLLRHGRVSRVVELHTMVQAVAGGERMLASVKAVDERYPLEGHVVLRPTMSLDEALGRSAAGRDGVVIEQELSSRLGVGVGDVIEIGDARLPVRAILVREPDHAARLFNLAPRLMLSSEALQVSGLLQPGSLATYRYRVALHEGLDVMRLRSDLMASGSSWRIRTWQEAEPRIGMFLERMEVNLVLTGLFALLAGGVGISGGVRGYLHAKRLHIATMKSLGNTSGRMFALYLAQLIWLGLLAMLVAHALAVLGPVLVSRLAGDRFPLPLESGVYVKPLLTSSVYGLLILLIFTVIPLASACRVRPAVLFRGGHFTVDTLPPGRVAWCALAGLVAVLSAFLVWTHPDRRLALWFLASVLLCFGAFRFAALSMVRLLARCPRPSRAVVRLALAEASRRSGPAVGIIFSLAIGMTALVTVAQVRSHLLRLITDTLPSDAPSYFVLGIPPDRLDAFESLLETMPEVTHFARFPALRGRITRINGVNAHEANIDPAVSWAIRGDRFLSHAATPPPGTVLRKGQWWPSDEEDLPPQVSITADLAEGFGVTVGDTLTLNVLGRDQTATIANLREVDWSSLQLQFAIIMNPSALKHSPQTVLASITLDPRYEQSVYPELSSAFPEANLIETRAVLDRVASVLKRIGHAFSMLAGVVLLTGFLVLSGAMAADQQRRMRDAIVFKVCGATRGDVTTAFALEFTVLGLLAGALSLPAGSLAARGILSGFMNTPYVFEWVPSLLMLLPGLLLVVVTGLVGTWNVLDRKPASWLRDA